MISLRITRVKANTFTTAPNLIIISSHTKTVDKQRDVPDVSIPIDTIVGQSASGQILPNQGLEEDIHGGVFGDVEEESIASMDLQEHLSAMQNTKF